MATIERYRKIKKIVKAVNQKRRAQARQIDILCHDLIQAHRLFIQKLDAAMFAVELYENMLDKRDLSELLLTAAQCIHQELPCANVAFFLKQKDSFQLHLFQDEPTENQSQERLLDSFSNDLVLEICRQNRISLTADLLAMGMLANPALLKELELFTLPLSASHHTLGFILVYMPTCHDSVPPRIDKLAAICPGLTRAIQVCRQDTVSKASTKSA